MVVIQSFAVVLMLRPFIVKDGVDYTEYHAQVSSKTRPRWHDVFVRRKWDGEVTSECSCEADYFRKNGKQQKECNHIQEVLSELKKFGEIDDTDLQPKS
jgi:hypothetical protein